MTHPVRRWGVAWVGGALIGVGNGAVRDATYGKRLSEYAAHQVSVVTAILAFGSYFNVLQRRWPLADRDEARRVGWIWLGLTCLFELGFGRAVAKKTWRDLLADYNLRRGRTWPLVLLWLWRGPAIIRAWDTAH